VKHFNLMRDLPELKKVPMPRNVSFQALFLLLATFLSFVSGWDINNQNDRHACQAYSQDPLNGCDRERTVYVDVVSSESKYKTVQSGKPPIPLSN
jgi:hypothetical protein